MNIFFSRIFIYRKMLQSVPWPTYGSQPPRLNSESGWNIIEADGKYATNLMLIYDLCPF
jgi:hypothetical protein